MRVALLPALHAVKANPVVVGNEPNRHAPAARRTHLQLQRLVIDDDRRWSTSVARFTSLPTFLVAVDAGFIGSHLVTRLIKQRETVRVIDTFSTGTRNHLDVLRIQGGPI
jgi:hypothetical protein